MEWIEWHGSEDGPPEIDGLRCDMKLRDGTVLEYENCQDYWEFWTYHCRPKCQIVAYRPCTPD